MDSSASSIELDASFQRKLEFKRQATNKENSQPPDLLPFAPVVVLQKEEDRNMPLGEIVLDHSGEPIRSIPNWILKEQSMHKENNRRAGSSDSGNAEQNGTENADQSKYFTEYTDSSLPDMNRVNINDDDENQSRSFAFDSLNQGNVNEVSASGNCPDDTLEELEYVSKNGELNYVPVKSRKESETTTYMSTSEVILIDSSPENSFTTAKTHMDGKSIMTSNMTFATARESNVTTRSWAYSENDDELPQPVEHYSIDKKSDSSDSTNAETLPSSDHLSIGDTSIPDFDNTLERVDYLMEIGRKLQPETVSTVKAVAVKQSDTMSPRPVKRNAPNDVPALTVTTPKGSQKKTPVAVKSASKFKRPENRASPLRAKPPIAPSSSSKIPTLKIPSSTSKAQFRHIASPVATYIKNTPEIPLIKTVRSTKPLFNPNFVSRGPDNHDVTTQSSGSINQPTILPKVNLSRKVFKQASNSHVSN